MASQNDAAGLAFLRSKRLMDRNTRLPVRNAARLGSSTSRHVACAAARAAAEGGSTAGCSTSGTMPRLLSLANVFKKMPAKQQLPWEGGLFIVFKTLANSAWGNCPWLWDVALPVHKPGRKGSHVVTHLVTPF